MISIKNSSPSQINRSNMQLAHETIEAYKQQIAAINYDTDRVLKLLNKNIQYRAAQLYLLDQL